ncbi:MAG: LacI family transcriptional regulator [Clostridia bacterium]|nr:LacI family transcriptional regulator [Clostridia bacterium]
MNMKKLAEKANVSVGTISKVFSNSKEISKETKDKIIKIAKENGCFEKYNKNKYDKKIVAVICPEINSAYYANMVTYLEKKLSENNLQTIISISNFNQKNETDLVSYFSSNSNADAIILIGNYSFIKYNKEIPIVSIGKSKNNEIDCVYSRSKEAFYDAIKLLKDNGHTKIAYLGEQLTKSYEKNFIEALRYYALPVHPEFIITDKERFETAGYNAMNKILEQKDMPTAIITAYDYIALGAIQAIRAKGLNVPDDFSIIGSDNISFASHYNISLTTIDKNNNECCDKAVELIIKKLSNNYYKLRQSISIRSELIIRNSVKDISEKH